MKLESKPKKARKLSKNQILIKKFVNVEFFCNKNFWPREMKMLNKLIGVYGIEFLEWLSPPSNYKVSTLAFFLTKDGKNYLSDQLFEYQKTKNNLSPQQSNIKMEEYKVGEDAQIVKKPKSLKDFLNLFK
jgi:hypothetical protein